MTNPINLRDLLPKVPKRTEREKGRAYTINDAGEIEIKGQVYIDSNHLHGHDSLIIDDCKVTGMGSLTLVDIPILKIKNLVSNSLWTESIKIYKGGLTSLEGITQNSGGIDLSYNDITSVEGFIMNGELDLDFNNLTSLNGIHHSPGHTLWVEYNDITTLEGYECRGELWLEGNPITNGELIYWDGYSSGEDMYLSLPSGKDSGPPMLTLEANSLARVTLEKVRSLTDKFNLVF